MIPRRERSMDVKPGSTSYVQIVLKLTAKRSLYTLIRFLNVPRQGVKGRIWSLFCTEADQFCGIRRPKFAINHCPPPPARRKWMSGTVSPLAPLQNNTCRVCRPNYVSFRRSAVFPASFASCTYRAKVFGGQSDHSFVQRLVSSV